MALDPRIMPVSPAFAIKKCMDQTGMNIEQMDILEMNEAFACVPLVSAKLLSNKRFMPAGYGEMVREASEAAIHDDDENHGQALKKDQMSMGVPLPPDIRTRQVAHG